MTTDKKIEDYLHLYLGCEVLYKGEVHFLCGLSKPYKTNDKTYYTFSVRPDNEGFRSTIYSLQNLDDIKLLLRPLSDMTEEEKSVSDKFNVTSNLELAEWFRYLLSKHFDLFGLIEAGLAIDKTKN